MVKSKALLLITKSKDQINAYTLIRLKKGDIDHLLQPKKGKLHKKNN